MEPISIPRLYHISNDGFPFYTGFLQNGTQVIMGVQQPEIVQVEFDAGGNFLRMSATVVEKAKWDEKQIELRQSQMGFRQGQVSIRSFFLPERWIGIADLPDHYQEVLDHPEQFDEENRQDLLNDIHVWRENGDFVFYWSEDYYYSQDGEMASS